MMGKDLFEITALDGHVLKFNWTKYISIEYESHVIREHNEHISPEFSISTMCNVKWKMICQEISNWNGTSSFKIGLTKLNSEQCAVDVSFFVKIIVSGTGKEVPKYDSFEFNFTQKDQYFSQAMTMKILPKIRAYEQYAAGLHMYISGIIIAPNCCKTRKKDNELMNISRLQQDFKTFFKSKQIADVTLNVRNEILPAHKFVLSARSPVFQKMFSQDLAEKQQNSVQIDDIEKSVMEAFLTFLYTGVIEDHEFNTIFELYSVADKYEVTTLFNTCRDILISYISVNTVTPVLKLADMHSDDELKDFAVKYICDNFSKVEITDEWEELLDMHPRLASYTLRNVSTSITK